jgi:hypothetical protein
MRSADWFEKDLVGDTSGHESARQLMAIAAAKAAAVSRPTLAIAVATMSLAALFGAKLLLLLPLLFGAMFAAKLLKGSLRRDAYRRARASAIRLPEMGSFTDGRVKAMIRRLITARQAIRKVAEAAPAGRAFDLSKLIAGVPRLERRVVVLATRIEYLTRFLELSPLCEARADLSRITASAARPGAAGPDLPRAAELCQRRLSTLLDFTTQIQRLLGRAELALSALEGLPVQMAMLQLRRLDACDDDHDDDAFADAADAAATERWCQFTDVTDVTDITEIAIQRRTSMNVAVASTG